MPESNQTRATADGPAPGLPSQSTRTLISFLLFLHFFALAVGVASQSFRSSLTMNLRSVPLVRTYLQLLDMDLSYQFHWTFLLPDDFDHFIEAELTLPDGQVRPLVLPQVGTWPGQRFRRYERLARAIAGGDADDELSGLAAQSVAARLVAETSASGGTIRCPSADVDMMIAEGPFVRPRSTDSQEFRRLYYRDAFQAALVVSNGGVELMKSAPAAETAPAPRAGGSR